MEKQTLNNELALLDVARTLTPLQRQILASLRDRGPGALLELAVRLLKFPEEIAEPLADLQTRRLVVGGEGAGAAIQLTATGEQLAARLRDTAFLQQLEPPKSPAGAELAGADARLTQLSLLQKLGDLALQDGDSVKASDYYKQALEVATQLSTQLPSSAPSAR